MRKHQISAPPREESTPVDWLRLDQLADVAVTSESESFPVEAALLPQGQGWRAQDPGEQTLRLVFHEPIKLHRVQVRFEEHERERTQEFVIRTAPTLDGPWRDLVRQQFNFSPRGASLEIETYKVDLPAVRALELTIIPDIRGGAARASLRELRLA